MTYWYVVEQTFFVIFFSRALAQFTTSNLILHKLCVGNDTNHYLGKVCPNEEEAEKGTTELNTYLFVLGNVGVVVACTVGGFWSDRHQRRKPLMWFPVVGWLISYSTNIVFVYFWSVPGYVVAIFNGVMSFFGEHNLLYTGGLCYITDHSPKALRSFRVGILLGVYYVSTPIGRGLAGYLNVHLGFIACYLLSIVLLSLSLLVMAFFVHEKTLIDQRWRKTRQEKTSRMERALSFYNEVDLSEEDSHSDKSGKAVQSHEVDKETHPEDIGSIETGTVDNNREIESKKIVAFANNVGAQKPTSNDTSEETEWTDVPKKSKSKQETHYNAYMETKRPPLKDEEKQPPQRSLFAMAFLSLYENLKILFKPRTENRTKILVAVVFNSPLMLAPMLAENSVFPLFVRYKFGWTEEMYGLFAAFKLTLIIFGIAFTVLILNRCLKVPDAAIGVLASIADTLACVGYILVSQSWQMFLVPILDLFHGSAQISCSSIVSNNADESERGKLFALKAAVDGLVTLVLYPLYNSVYRATVGPFTAAFFLISAVCSFPGIILFSYIWYLQREKPYILTTKL